MAVVTTANKGRRQRTPEAEARPACALVKVAWILMQ